MSYVCRFREQLPADDFVCGQPAWPRCSLFTCVLLMSSGVFAKFCIFLDDSFRLFLWINVFDVVPCFFYGVVFSFYTVFSECFMRLP